ncbi:anti-sigma-28 factor, FlgM [Thermosinus carboxydivorans Nor1]|uniref:Negative regulator of flagellin synthesis n=1 Tax=Thermosinus carboxydivorans Nor1 TaxID=401526 RepID=A1HT59_9FIRM|nr:flagellar biosynthesis anti-sigma factor FlgM [Thermosinus carboxydivorans]EAX46821.1 anti-sigma-28 factor, FlgM [Thermosinus carboxydivorans Nor1]
MIISNTQVQNILKVYGEQTKVGKNAKPPSAGPVQRTDEVVLSAQAQEFSQILQALKNMPEVREDKVKELADRIATGNYHVDAKEIADKMLGRIVADRLR